MALQVTQRKCWSSGAGERPYRGPSMCAASRSASLLAADSLIAASDSRSGSRPPAAIPPGRLFLLAASDSASRSRPEAAIHPRALKSLSSPALFACRWRLRFAEPAGSGDPTRALKSLSSPAPLALPAHGGRLPGGESPCANKKRAWLMPPPRNRSRVCAGVRAPDSRRIWCGERQPSGALTAAILGWVWLFSPLCRCTHFEGLANIAVSSRFGTGGDIPVTRGSHAGP